MSFHFNTDKVAIAWKLAKDGGAIIPLHCGTLTVLSSTTNDPEFVAESQFGCQCQFGYQLLVKLNFFFFHF